MAARPFPILRWVPLSLVALGTAAALVLAAAPWSSAPTGSVPVGEGALRSFSVPAGYHVVYRITASGIAPYLEELWVRRPFQSVDEILSGSTPDSPVDLATVSRLGDEVLSTGHSQAALVHVAVAPAGSDPRLDAVLSTALAAGDLVYEGTSSVLGRTCWQYRSAQPLSVTRTMTTPGSSNYVQSCIDSDGIMVAEQTYKSGRPVEARRAVSLALGAEAAAGGDYSMTGAATPFNQGGGSMGSLTLDSAPPGLSWTATWIPAGFSHSGRYAVTPSQPQAFDQSSAGPPNPFGVPNGLVSELDDAYVSGPDVIVVQQGVSAGAHTVFKPPPGGRPVALGPVLGTGQLTLSAEASVVSAEPDGGSHFVRVTGTVSPAVLLRVARSLVVEKPGRLVQLGGS
jgi:hypothetical protein